jgi:hypothetical protein
MPSISNRKLLRVGESLGVTLPRDWVRGHNLRPGDDLELSYNEDVTVTVKKNGASAPGGRTPGAPTRAPVAPTVSDGRGPADDGD